MNSDEEDERKLVPETTQDSYLDWRSSSAATAFEASKSFDKYLLTLASGSFGISIGFVHQIAPSLVPFTRWLLVLAWLGFSAAMLATLLSLHLAQRAILETILHEDRKYAGKRSKAIPRLPRHFASLFRIEGRDQWRSLVDRLNGIAMILFTGGLFFQLIFCFLNLPASK